MDTVVKAAPAALADSYELSSTRRERRIVLWDEKIAEYAEFIARRESNQNGKLLSKMQAQGTTA